MNQTLRWLLLVPVLFAASAVSFALLTLIWNVVANVNIVSQNDVISLGLANFGINAFSAAAGVAAGSAVVPSNKSKAASAAATMSVVVALALLVWAFARSSPLIMSLGWHVWCTVGWLVGAVWAAMIVRGNNKITDAPAT